MICYNNRNEVPEKYKWDLTDMFKDEKEFKSTIPVLKNASMTLLHIPSEKIIKKKKKIEKSIKNIKYGNNSKLTIGSFDLWQTNSSYFVGEIKIDVGFDKFEQKDNENDLEKLNEENSLFFEIQSKINTIFKDNKINEYYIEIV